MIQEATPTTIQDTLPGSGGPRIAYRRWKSREPARAVVVICHGVNSHSGQYERAAAHFTANGFTVYAVDLRGRGRSEGTRYYVDDVGEYVTDLRALITFAKTREPGIPVYLLGHSAGGVVSCTYALSYQSEITGLICESFAFEVPAPGFVLAAIKWISRLAPRLPVLRLKNEDFSRDPDVVRELNSDPLIRNEVQPAKTVAALVRADERLRREFSRIALPVFILHGTADKATKPSGSRFFYDTVGSTDKTLKLYEGHYHDLLSDVGRESVLADITKWIEDRIGDRFAVAAMAG